MTRFDLNVDQKFQRKLTAANKAFSAVEYPDAYKVIETLVLHRIALILEETFGGIKEGDATLRAVLLDPDPSEVDFVVLLDSKDICSLAFRLGDGDDWPSRRTRNDLILSAVRECLRDHGLLRVLEDIGITITFLTGSSPKEDIIVFESTSTARLP